MMAKAGGFCRIQRGGADGVLQTPSGELSHVADGEVHGENAAGKFSVQGAAAVFHLYLQRPELVSAFGHAGGGGCVGDENGALDAFSLQKKLDDFRSDVNAVGNNVGGELRIGEYFSDNAGLAMVERSHRIESVSGVACSGFRAGASGGERSIRVAHADQNTAPRRFRDYFERSGEFGSDGHHADVTARGLPEALKDLQRGFDQIRGGMNSAALVAKKWTFEVNAERQSLQVAIG